MGGSRSRRVAELESDGASWGGYRILKVRFHPSARELGSGRRVLVPGLWDGRGCVHEIRGDSGSLSSHASVLSVCTRQGRVGSLEWN